MNFRINWSISELNTQVNPTTCWGDTDCWFQQVTTPTLAVTCWNQQSVCILPSTCTGGQSPPPFRLDCKLHTDCWIQQVTARVGAVSCWIQQFVLPKQVVGFTCVFNSEVDQLMRKSIVNKKVFAILDVSNDGTLQLDEVLAALNPTGQGYM